MLRGAVVIGVAVADTATTGAGAGAGWSTGAGGGGGRNAVRFWVNSASNSVWFVKKANGPSVLWRFAVSACSKLNTPSWFGTGSVMVSAIAAGTNS